MSVADIQVHRGRLHRSSAEIIDAATARGIPWFTLDAKRHTLIQLGHGVHQRRIRTTTTSDTPFLGTTIALDKALTNELLRAVGVPVPNSLPAADARSAVQAAMTIGYPVVVKPRFGKSAIGVSTHLTSAPEVRRAVAKARKDARDAAVVVERHVTGRDFRVLVVGGKAVAVSEWVPARVIGDGQHTVQELIEIANADPRRGVHKEKPHTRISLGPAIDEQLDTQGLTLGSVPDAGRRVVIGTATSPSHEGFGVDRTDEIHPENRSIAEVAVATVGLDVAGVDIVCQDISVPLHASEGAVVEVNQSPGLRPHLYPGEGIPRDVLKAYLDLLFPGSDGRVPIVTLACGGASASMAELVGHILAHAGHVPGVATQDGLLVGGVRMTTGDMSGWSGARAVLRHPWVDVAVLEVTPASVIEDGLGYDRGDVAVLLRPGGARGVQGDRQASPELESAVEVVADVVRSSGALIVDAADQRMRRLVGSSHANVVLCDAAAGTDGSGHGIEDHHRRGGSAWSMEESGDEGWLVYRDAQRRHPIMATRDVPALRGPRPRLEATSLLAAAAACHAAGVDLADIERGLRTFMSSPVKTP